MKAFVIIFCFVSAFVKGQSASFFSVGVTLSNVEASSDITSLRVHSDYRTGFFVGFGKEYKVAEKLFCQPQLKILQAGGQVKVSSLLGLSQIPQNIQKYSGITYDLTLYQSELQINGVYKTSWIHLFAGVQSSLIFYGNLKDNLPQQPSPPTSGQSQEVKKSHTYLTLRANYGFSLKLGALWQANVGYHLNITNPVSVHYQDVEISFSQNIFQIGVSYFMRP